MSKKKLKLSKPKRTRRGRGSECELDDAAAAKRRLLAWASIYGSKCKVKKIHQVKINFFLLWPKLSKKIESTKLG